MGHTLADPDLAYQRLQQRLDRMPTGAPGLPGVPADPAPALHRRGGRGRGADADDLLDADPGPPDRAATEAELGPMVDAMAAKGLVMDLENHGQRYVALAPVVIGFFEFTFMRVREDAPMEQLAALFHEYMFDDDSFAHAVFRGSTQIGRSLVREEALPEDPQVEVLDWELATHIVVRGPVGGRLAVPVPDARGS